MNKIMTKVFEIFKKEIEEDEKYYIITDEPKFQMFDYMDIVSIGAEDPENEECPIMVSFYSSCYPAFAGNIIRTLMENEVTDFDIMENLYLDFDENDICQGMLFGDEADQRYREDIYNEIMNEKFKNLIPKKKDNPDVKVEEDKKLG